MRSECERIGKLISGYVDEGLKPADKEHVAAHLDTCETCAAEVERVRLMVGRLGGLGVEKPPFDLWPGVAHRIMTPPRRSGIAARIGAFAGWRAIIIPAAAATAAVIVMIAHPVQHVGPTSSRPQSVAESSAENRAYMQAYASFRGEQALSDRDALAAAAQLQHTQGAP